MKRVLQLIDSFNQGGSERQALQLTRLLKVHGRFDVRLASLNAEGSLRASIDDLDLGSVPSFPLTSFYDRNAIHQLQLLVRWLKSEQIDILHTHDFYTNVFGMTAGALARVPVRIASMRETEGMRTGAQKKAQRVSYALAHHIVVNSSAVRNKLTAEGGREDKISIVYNGLDIDRLAVRVSRSEVLKMLGLGEKATSQSKFVTIVANMRHEVKDYPMFFRAAKRVREAIPDVLFLLAGEGELTPALQAVAAEVGISDCTVFLGRCERVAELLNISDVCVLSSKAEGFSNSIIEYMAAGKPVVATNVGGAAEAIIEGETGFLVPSGDDEMMAVRIIELLKDSDKAHGMGDTGRQVVATRFSCDAQLNSIEQLYDRLGRQDGVQS